MNNRGLAFIGVVIILAGVLLLAGNLLNISLGAYCLPLGLILLGVFVMLRPRLAPEGTKGSVLFIADVERGDNWTVGDEEIWSFIADIDFDLSKADIPLGDSVVRGYGFINDVAIHVPPGVGVAVDANGFVTSFKEPGESEEDNFLVPVHWQSEGYKGAERRVRFDLTGFISEVKVRYT